MEKCAIHIEKSKKMQQYIKIYYSIFILSSTCFGWHTAHHQEPKTALEASGLHTWKVVGRVVAGRCQRPATTRPTTFHICKPDAASAVLGSWWWTVCRPKHVELQINMKWNFYTLLPLVGLFIWIILLCTDPRTSNTSYEVPNLTCFSTKV
jgi:hypothetical protein